MDVKKRAIMYYKLEGKITSNEWDKDWQSPVLSALVEQHKSHNSCK